MPKPPAKTKKPQRIRVNVKLKAVADSQGLVQTLSKVPGVKAIEQTFPGESDKELSTLYIVETDSSDAKSVLQKLRRRPDIEYVERPAPRRLV